MKRGQIPGRLDDRVMWKARVKTIVKKELKVLWLCNAFIGST